MLLLKQTWVFNGCFILLNIIIVYIQTVKSEEVSSNISKAVLFNIYKQLQYRHFNW